MAKKKKKAEDEEEESGGSKKKMIIGGVVGAFAVYKFVLAPAPAPVDEEAAAAEAQAAALEEGEIFALDEIVVNLADTDSNRYLRAGIALVLDTQTPATVMETEAPIALDAAIEVLSEKSFEELREPGAKAEIRDELSAAVRAAYGEEKVVRVLLTTFVMQ